MPMVSRSGVRISTHDVTQNIGRSKLKSMASIRLTASKAVIAVVLLGPLPFPPWLPPHRRKRGGAPSRDHLRSPPPSPSRAAPTAFAILADLARRFRHPGCSAHFPPSIRGEESPIGPPAVFRGQPFDQGSAAPPLFAAALLLLSPAQSPGDQSSKPADISFAYSTAVPCRRPF